MGKVRGQSSWPGRWWGPSCLAQFLLAVFAECPCVPGLTTESLPWSLLRERGWDSLCWDTGHAEWVCHQVPESGNLWQSAEGGTSGESRERLH